MVVKSQIILYIYDKIINGKSFTMDEIINEFNISIRTFRRYIAEINAYLCNNFRNEMIVYDYKKSCYFLNRIDVQS